MAASRYPPGSPPAWACSPRYLFALNVVELRLVDARTVATSVLVLVGLYFVFVLEASDRVRTFAVGVLCLTLLVLYVLVLVFDGTRTFFDLHFPGFWSLVAVLGGTGLAIAGLVLTDDRFVPEGLRGRLSF